jgi:plastocyanin
MWKTRTVGQEARSWRMRWLGLVPLVALVALVAVLLSQATGGEVAAQGRRVTIQDNKAPSPAQGFDPAQGRWQFNPTNVEVTRGERIEFQSPPGNDHPHTVTNLARTSSPTALPVSFVAGNLFDSGLIQPGGSWTLDTSALAVGHYPYVCRLHPWMTGEVTVK